LPEVKLSWRAREDGCKGEAPKGRKDKARGVSPVDRDFERFSPGGAAE